MTCNFPKARHSRCYTKKYPNLPSADMSQLVVRWNFSLPKSLTKLIEQEPPTTCFLAKPIVARRSLCLSRRSPADPHPTPLPPPHPSHPTIDPLKHSHDPQRGRQPRQPRHRKRRRHPRPRRPGGCDSGPGPGPTAHQRRPIGAHALPAIGTGINAKKRRANRRPETELRAPPRELIPACHVSASLPKNTPRWRHLHSSLPSAAPSPPTGTRPC